MWHIITSMAALAAKVLELNKEQFDLQNVNTAINRVKSAVILNENMSPVGYNILDLVQKWVKKEISLVQEEKEKLSDLNLV